MKIVLLIVAVAVVVITVWMLKPSSVNVSERVSTDLGADANCYDAGLEELAGEREEIYDCSYTYDHTVIHVCVAVANGDVYVVRAERCS